MKNTKKYLILQLQQACYNSYTYFTGQIARVLRARGHEVIVFSSAKRPIQTLEQFAGAHFDAVIDCNSGAPRLMMEKGGYFFDSIDAPFFNLLLDHPLYHHDSLKCGLKNYHVRCLDENHAAYVRKYYPHIKSVGLWIATGSSAAEVSRDAGVAGGPDVSGCADVSGGPDVSDCTDAAGGLDVSCCTDAADNVNVSCCTDAADNVNVSGGQSGQSAAGDISTPLPISKRQIPILFAGTYTDPDEIMHAIGELPPFIQTDLKLLIAELLAHTEQTIEGAIRSLGDRLESYLPEAMPLYVQSCFLADTYVRAYRRRKLIRAAERARLPLALYGDSWEKLPRTMNSTLTLHGQVPFSHTFSLMADSRITLNLMPEFKAGFHDRIFSAMLNGSVAVTDPSKLLAREFTDGKELLFYDAAQLDEACERLRRALETPEKLQQIADAGLVAGMQFSWEKNLPDFTALR